MLKHWSYNTLPDHMRHQARAYLEDRCPPGGFLYAVLSNNLAAAASRADSANRAALLVWADWLTTIPMIAWGSSEAVEAYLSEDENDNSVPQVVKVTVKKYKGEWAARYSVNGKYQEGQTYYAGDDKEDAESTAKNMRLTAMKQGYTVEGTK